MSEQKCFSKEHEEIKSSCYCADCKIYMCKKCEGLHSQLFKSHKKYNLDKDIKQIFTGFCKEKNHFDELDYYCKTHNVLSCSTCIAKIKRKGKGQHTNCEVCLIEEIKDEKLKILKKNIKNLENLSKTIDTSIDELKAMFEKITKSKEELQHKIQTIFTEIRNKINEREDQLLSEVQKLYNNTYINDAVIKQIDKLPNNIKILLEKGNLTDKEWNHEDKLSSLLNECINIENNIVNINETNELIKKSKDEMKTDIKFFPETKNDFDIFFKSINTFGELYRDDSLNLIYNDNNYFYINLRSTNKILPNCFSFELKGFKPETYNKYYPEEIEFKKNFVLTISLEIKNMNSSEQIIDIFNKLNKEKKFSIRKSNNKIILDFEIEGNIPILKLVQLLYKYDINLNEILLLYKSNLDLNKILKMNLDEFFKCIFSTITSLKCKFKNLKKTYYI